MRMLSDVPWGELREGDFVISRRGTIGKIEELIPREFATRKENNEIYITWVNGNVSLTWHFQCDAVQYDELSNLVLRESNEIE